ncbi:MAG TPA: hypothetical protein VIM70_02815 [Clostridium sp.]|uniref:hypothetical protein n=1 Tax=Clostridium sp. TaxID=1506 RepID=UPI002F92AF82
MSQFINIRGDIIDIETYFKIEVYYKEYLKQIFDAGGYCFFDQFKRNIKNGKYIIEKMEEFHLIRKENYTNSYKYIYLTNIVLKYFYLKDDFKDYSGILKNLISIKQLEKKPSEKKLFSSSIKYNLLFDKKNNYMIKENLLKELNEEFMNQNGLFDLETKIELITNKKVKLKEEFNNNKQNFDSIMTSFKAIQDDSELAVDTLKEKQTNLIELNEKLEGLRLIDVNKKIQTIKEIENVKRIIVKLEYQKKIDIETIKLKEPLDKLNNEFIALGKELKALEKQKEDKKSVYENFNKLQIKIKNLYDQSMIIARLKDNILTFNIIDTGNFKTATSYMKLINDLYIESYKINSITVQIISYSQNRSENLKKEFKDVEKNKLKANKTMQKFEHDKGLSRSNRKNWKFCPEFYIKIEKLYNNPTINNIEISDEVFYMETYKDNSSQAPKYAKRKDIESIKAIKQNIKIGEEEKI